MFEQQRFQFRLIEQSPARRHPSRHVHSFGRARAFGRQQLVSQPVERQRINPNVRREIQGFKLVISVVEKQQLVVPESHETKALELPRRQRRVDDQTRPLFLRIGKEPRESFNHPMVVVIPEIVRDCIKAAGVELWTRQPHRSIDAVALMEGACPG